MKTSASFIILFCSAVFLLFFMLGKTPLRDFDEAFYGVVAKNIVASGDWGTFTFNGEKCFDRTPVGLWLMAVSYKILGINEFATRFWSSFFGVGIALLTYFFAKKLFNADVGFLSGIILLTCFPFLLFTREGRLESTYTFFMFLGIFLFWLAREKPLYLIPAAASLGLSGMSKHTAVVVLPLLIIVIYAFIAGEQGIFFKREAFLALLLFIAILLPWHIIQYHINGREFIDKSFTHNLFERALTSRTPHRGNLFFYVNILYFKYLPSWICLSLLAVPSFIKNSLSGRNREYLILLLWISVVFAVFSVSRTKFDWYLYPLFMPLSIVTGKYLYDKRLHTWKSAFAAVFFTVALLSSAISLYALINDNDAVVSRSLGKDINQYVPDSRKIYVCDMPYWSLLYYASKPVVPTSGIVELLSVLPPGTTSSCVIKETAMSELSDRNINFSILKQESSYVLVRVLMKLGNQ